MQACPRRCTLKSICDRAGPVIEDAGSAAYISNNLDCGLATVNVISMLSRHRRFDPSDNVTVRSKGQVHVYLLAVASYI